MRSEIYDMSMSNTSTALMTAEELLQLPRGEFRAELINGELITMPLAGYPHGRIAARIAGPLEQFVFDKDFGAVFIADTGFKLTSNPDTVLGPDVAFVSKQRMKEIDESKVHFPGPPDLAVEVLSPGDRPNKVRTKISQWLGFGAKQVWIVDPKFRTVAIYRSLSDTTTFSGDAQLEADDILPGFRISLERIFKV
jgi:Uma2 family endonuclease